MNLSIMSSFNWFKPYSNIYTVIWDVEAAFR